MAQEKEIGVEECVDEWQGDLLRVIQVDTGAKAEFYRNRILIITSAKIFKKIACMCRKRSFKV